MSHIKNTNFVHFRSQSSYSFLESILKIEDLLILAQKYKMPALCLSDRHNMSGALEFSTLSKKYNIQPISACILNIIFPELNFYSEILIISKDELGFKNLLQLISKSFSENLDMPFPYITESDLFAYNEGLIILSAYDEGAIGKSILSKKIDNAVSLSKKLLSVFGDRFYFEIMRHNLLNEQIIEENYINIAYDLKIPLLATNKILFHSKEKFQFHDVLRCISSGEKLNAPQRKKLSQEFYFKDQKEISTIFNDIPSAIENSMYLVQRCSFTPHSVKKPSFPKFSEKRQEKDIIIENANAGLLAKFNKKAFDWDLYKKRLDYELSIIIDMDFAGYFLIVADFVNWSKKNDIAVGPGRGSGAGSIIAWTLGITDLDPIEYGLLFERFLNPERVSMPDFDIDFCQEKRDQVIEYVLNKYGYDRIAHIITFGKLQAKAVIKDVSRVLGLRYEIADYLTELVPFNAVSPVTLIQAIKEVKELNLAFQGKENALFPENTELIKKVLEVSLQLEGLYRNSSTHAAGIVISADKIVNKVPVQKDKNSRIITVQYSMKYAEMAGLVKFDFLGLQTLSLIQNTVNKLKEKQINLDINKIDFSDTKPYKLLSKGLSTGIFQFESQGIKSALRELLPDNISDIIALGALYRPGPMDNISSYIKRKHGEEKIEYMHPMLEPILKETYGIIIYQEQVIEIAQKLANYTIASADLLRRAMGKKIKSEMAEQEKNFLKGSLENNIEKQTAKLIFDHVAKFAGYGFNKSHASAYGVISYQTAYLKAYYPTEFMISLLNLEIHDSDKIFYLVDDLKNLDIKMLPPSINESEIFFSNPINNEKDIIFALLAIKNMPKNLAIAIYNERKKNGKFLNIINFLERIDTKLLNKRILENLIKSDAFSSLHSNRKQILESLSKLLQYSVYFHKNKDSYQKNFLSISQNSNEILLSPTNEYNISELALQEFESLGMFIKYHPLMEYHSMIDKCNIRNSTYILQNRKILTSFEFAGVVVKKFSRMSKRGRFLILNISDTKGMLEVNIFDEELLSNFGKFLTIKTMLLLKCYNSNGKIIVKNIIPLINYLTNKNFELNFYLENSEQILKSIKNIKNKSEIELKNSSLSFILKLKNGFFAKIQSKNIL